MMIASHLKMPANHFNKSLKYLNLSVYAAAPILGISLRQAQRYASGEDPQEISGPVANLLILLQKQIFDLKKRRHELIGMIEAIDQRGLRVGTNNRDETAVWRGQLKVWLDEIEDLLRNHPSGLPSQLD
jgi:hypothetical protein